MSDSEPTSSLASWSRIQASTAASGSELAALTIARAEHPAATPAGSAAIVSSCVGASDFATGSSDIRHCFQELMDSPCCHLLWLLTLRPLRRLLALCFEPWANARKFISLLTVEGILFALRLIGTPYY